MSFDLSLAKEQEVAASKEYQQQKDPKTGEVTKKMVTDGGVKIDKSKAPKIIADGPLGYKYTEYLNQVLSNESMAAIVAAADEVEVANTDTIPRSGTPTGYLKNEAGGAVNQIDTGDMGYIYVMDAGQVNTADMLKVADSVFKRKNMYPNSNIGVALINNGQISEGSGNVLDVMQRAGIPTVVTQEGLERMARSMLSDKE